MIINVILSRKDEQAPTIPSRPAYIHLLSSDSRSPCIRLSRPISMRIYQDCPYGTVIRRNIMHRNLICHLTFFYVLTSGRKRGI